MKVDYHPEYNYEDVLKNISSYDALVVRSKVVIDKAIIDAGINLKCIARSGAGMDAIDVDYAISRNIKCLNSPEGNMDAVGEHALGLLLCLFDKINVGDKEVRQHLWKREANRGLEIKGKTIGIIGYGHMGHAFAKRLSGFECNVIAYDNALENYSDKWAKQSSLQELFSLADIVSLHIPLNNMNYHLVNKEFLESFKKPFYLINTSRGKVVSIHDLLLAMQTKKVLGCALDVLETENFSNQMQTDNPLMKDLDKLFQMTNTVFTPHVAGWSVESYYKLASYLADKIIEVLVY